jgi:hypothetical protein
MKHLNAKRSLKRTAIVLGSVILLLFISSLVLMILDNYFFKEITIDFFSTAVSGSHEMNVPFSIIIEMFSSTGGILLGLKIDRYTSEKSEEELAEKMWCSIYILLSKLSEDIQTQPLLVLSNYKIHWEALLHTYTFSIYTLQSDEKYFELSNIFHFLDYHRCYWSDKADKKYSEIANDYTINIAFRTGLINWKIKIDEMTKTKVV